jgi:hypothetical protein
MVPSILPISRFVQVRCQVPRQASALLGRKAVKTGTTGPLLSEKFDRDTKQTPNHETPALGLGRHVSDVLYFREI